MFLRNLFIEVWRDLLLLAADPNEGAEQVTVIHALRRKADQVVDAGAQHEIASVSQHLIVRQVYLRGGHHARNR